ncbi:hypothetical protein QLX30_gp182 [Staphylococcus phage A3R]|uniref:Nicotinamide phosphoribosyltransferase n=1 Tax=Staphylococcus phage A3R TaxID=1195077 RepID=I6X4J6_9CAUD|nr:hypothetical protein QLX30_gp182 [Staphylococcus phage A3R]AFN38212.1 hypothetical protein phi_A3R_ORF157 [Staphylococcus phage A3R]
MIKRRKHLDHSLQPEKGWRTVPFNGYYEAHPTGLIRNKVTKKLIKGTQTRKNHPKWTAHEIVYLINPKKTSYSRGVVIAHTFPEMISQSRGDLKNGHVCFKGSDTVPVVDFLESYYNADVEKEMVVASIPATEHSVMCANGNYETMDEYETYKRMLTEIYPTGIFSIVSDTWDFWGNMTKTLPRLKDIIMERNGKVVIRPDSGDPVKIICGDPDADTEYERKGAVEVLWDTFGGTETEKGYKVLDEHVGLIYGDSINYERAQQICEGLKEKGFASINVVLGVGSFSYQFNTRDTHGFAIKATYAKIKNEEKLIYKNPKTDSGKRSHKGRVAVYKDGSWEDNLNLHQWLNKQNLNQLERVFEDGKLYRDQSLSEIREIIKNN